MKDDVLPASGSRFASAEVKQGSPEGRSDREALQNQLIDQLYGVAMTSLFSDRILVTYVPAFWRMRSDWSNR